MNHNEKKKSYHRLAQQLLSARGGVVGPDYYYSLARFAACKRGPLPRCKYYSIPPSTAMQEEMKEPEQPQEGFVEIE